MWIAAAAVYNFFGLRPKAQAIFISLLFLPFLFRFSSILATLFLMYYNNGNVCRPLPQINCNREEF